MSTNIIEANVLDIRLIFRKDSTMNKLDEMKFNKNYQQLLQALKLQGKAIATIDAYSRAMHRVVQHFNCLPEQLTPETVKEFLPL